MQLRQVDLNLLSVFDAVMKHRSVALAAQQLSLTPSAVSHALGRLRHVLKDELFLRDETGMQPTPRALALAVPVRGSLALLEQALLATPFTPADSLRTFRLATGDYVCGLVLPRLVRRLARVAPQIDLKVIPVNRPDLARQLGSGRVDGVIGWFDTLPADLRRRTLFRESGVMVARQDHPLAQGVATQERLFDFPHLVVDLIGSDQSSTDGFVNDHGLVMRVWMERAVLQAQDLTARVAVSVPHFSAVPPLLRASDMVATLPRRLALQAVSEGGLVILDRSLEEGSVSIEVVWHARAGRDAGLSWLLDELTHACAELGEGAPTGPMQGVQHPAE